MAQVSARGVATPYILELDDIRAQKSEHLSAGGTRLHMRQVEYLHTFQSLVHDFRPSFKA